jgi:hypothetical protein
MITGVNNRRHVLVCRVVGGVKEKWVFGGGGGNVSHCQKRCHSPPRPYTLFSELERGQIPFRVTIVHEFRSWRLVGTFCHSLVVYRVFLWYN